MIKSAAMTNHSSSNKAPKLLYSKRVLDMMLYAVACDIATKVVHNKNNSTPMVKKQAPRSTK